MAVNILVVILVLRYTHCLSLSHPATVVDTTTDSVTVALDLSLEHKLEYHKMSAAPGKLEESSGNLEQPVTNRTGSNTAEQPQPEEAALDEAELHNELECNETTSREEEEEVHGVHVATWNYEYVKYPLLVMLFVLVTGVLKLVFHYAEWLSSVVPESCLLIIFGTVMGAVVHHTLDSKSMKLQPRLFMLFLLPPIVLDSAYGLNDRVFFNNIGTILLYALLGTVLNCFLIGPSLYGLSVLGAMGDITITFIQCQLFASFIVAVDPVAVLAIFQEVGVNDVLYFLVFGESLLNDAVTIVLYNTMNALSSTEDMQTSEIALAFASFFTVSLGGLCIGIISGILSALFTRTTSHVRIMEPLGMLVFAYLSYLCAELVHWSGIVSLIACGLVQSQYAFHNISRKSLTTIKYFAKMICVTAEAIIFLFLGLELIRINHVWHTGFVLWSLILCLVYRLLVTCGLTVVANKLQRIKPISMKEQFIMWYGGLRGAVCFALCGTLSSDFELKNMFLTTTFVIIIFTVFVQGITVKPLVVLFNIKRKETEKNLTMTCEIHKHVTDHLMAGAQSIIGQNWRDHRIRQFITHLNDSYFRRWFQRDPKTQDEQLLETHKQMSIKSYIRHTMECRGETDSAILTAQNKYTSQHTPLFDENGEVILPEQDIPSQLRARHISASKTSKPMRQRGNSLIYDFRATMAKKSVFGIHRTYDKNLTHPDDADFESHLHEKYRRLEVNAAYREASRCCTPVQTPQNCRRHASLCKSDQRDTTHTALGKASGSSLANDNKKGRGQSNGEVVAIEIEQPSSSSQQPSLSNQGDDVSLYSTGFNPGDDENESDTYTHVTARF